MGRKLKDSFVKLVSLARPVMGGDKYGFVLVLEQDTGHWWPAHKAPDSCYEPEPEPEPEPSRSPPALEFTVGQYVKISDAAAHHAGEIGRVRGTGLGDGHMVWLADQYLVWVEFPGSTAWIYTVYEASHVVAPWQPGVDERVWVDGGCLVAPEDYYCGFGTSTIDPENRHLEPGEIWRVSPEGEWEKYPVGEEENASKSWCFPLSSIRPAAFGPEPATRRERWQAFLLTRGLLPDTVCDLVDDKAGIYKFIDNEVDLATQATGRKDP